MIVPPHLSVVVLQECIEASGLGITAIAVALGVTRTILSALVHGKHSISTEMAVRLSKVFGGRAESWLAQHNIHQRRIDQIKQKNLEVA